MPQLDVIKFLDKYVKPATGCTEPIAVAYAIATAHHLLKEHCPNKYEGICKSATDNLEVRIKTDRDVFKNAMQVAIPNTAYGGNPVMCGMSIAGATAIFANSADELNLLEKVDAEAVASARNLLDSGRVIIEEVTDMSTTAKLDINVTVKCAYGGRIRTARARLEDNHTNVTELEIDGQMIPLHSSTNIVVAPEPCYFPETIGGLLDAVNSADMRPDGDLFSRLYEGIEMDLRLAEEGLRNDRNCGLSLGKRLQEIYELPGETFEEILINARKSDFPNVVEILAAAAGDARMGGANLPAMSSAGSGNQGLVAVLPVLVAGEMYGKSESDEKLCDAVLLSHLVTKFIADRSGYLSAMCGCSTKAGMGAAAGVAYLLEESDAPAKVNNAINYFAANLPGVICDGAKTGCSAKLSTGARQGAVSALMALNSVDGVGDNGFVSKDANETIWRLGRICKSMVPTDITLVEILQGK